MNSKASLSDMIYPELKTTHRLGIDVDYFDRWSSKIYFVLMDNHVDYVLAAPKPPASDVAGRKKWIRDDHIALHLIKGTLHDHLFISYDKYQTAKSLMDALTANFTKPSMSKRMAKLRNYVGHKMAEGDSVNMHLLTMQSMVDGLEREGLKIPEEVQAVMLMNSVPESWDDVMTTVRLKMDFDRSNSGKPDWSLDMVSSRLREIVALKEWRQKEEEAKQGILRPHFNGYCSTCGKYGRHCNCCTTM